MLDAEARRHASFFPRVCVMLKTGSLAECPMIVERGGVGSVLGPVALVLLSLCACGSAGVAPPIPGEDAESHVPEGDILQGTDGVPPDDGGGVPPPLPRRIHLVSWRIASSAEVGHDGMAISTPGFSDESWLPARVPGTVFGAQVDAGLFGGEAVLSGDALWHVPGWHWPFLPRPEDSPYGVPWWWRTEWDVSVQPGERVWLVFEGINYSADVYVNGRLVAPREEVAGAFREWRFDVTDAVREGGRCAAALSVQSPDVFSDLAIYFVDWNPMPPDAMTGLWMPARVEVAGPVRLWDPAVLPRLLPDGSADLTLVGQLTSSSKEPLQARIEGQLDGIRFEDVLSIEAGETRELRWTPQEVPALHLASPRRWWPAPLGTPSLYEIEIRVLVAGEISDAATFRFGVREVRAEVLPPNQLLYFINGVPILIRGAGYVPDIFLRYDPLRIRRELEYVAHLGLNAIRLEGKMQDHAFYELCDEMGILVMPGWCCCDAWEDWERWGPHHRAVASESLRSQLLRLRRHPSVFTWLNGSDFHPPPDVERMYLQVAKEVHWDLPIVSNATETPSEVTGPSGMKMTGPYNYVPPIYWYEAVPKDPEELRGRTDWPWHYGGAFGFNSESSPGYSVPPLDSLWRMMAPKDLWPPGDVFLFHSGGIGSSVERFRLFRDAMDRRLGPPSGLVDFVWKAQVLQYEAHRAMFEALTRNKYRATGHIQWMLNNAWPGLIWQLYDFYLRPGGSYFGARKALRPVHALYAHDDRIVYVVNQTLETIAGLRLVATVWTLDGTLALTREAEVGDLPADGKAAVLPLGAEVDALQATLAPVFFLDLHLWRDDQEVVRNTYWLALPDDVLHFEDTKDNLPRYTAADLSALFRMPLVPVQADPLRSALAGEDLLRFETTLHNPSQGIAWFVEALLWDSEADAPVLPIRWDDNFVTLFPGESRTLSALVEKTSVQPERVVLRLQGPTLAP